MDRSTKATLSTYGTWIQVSRLQKIYRNQRLQLRLATKPLAVRVVRMQHRQFEKHALEPFRIWPCAHEHKALCKIRLLSRRDSRLTPGALVHRVLCKLT